MLEYEKIREKNRLTHTAIDLLHLINEFGKLHKLKMRLLFISLMINYKWLKETRVEYISCTGPPAYHYHRVRTPLPIMKYKTDEIGEHISTKHC